MRLELLHQFSHEGGLVRACGPISGESNSYLPVVALEPVDALIGVRLGIGQKGMPRSDAKRKILHNPFEYSFGRERRQQRVRRRHQLCGFDASRPRWCLLSKVG